MNILQLCKAAERYELLCMMNLSEDEIRLAAERYQIPSHHLYYFIDIGVRDPNHRGVIFARQVSTRPHFVETVLLNSDFYEIWEKSVND